MYVDLNDTIFVDIMFPRRKKTKENEIKHKMRSLE